MSRLIHPEFLAELDPTPYPFADTASLESDTGYKLHGTFLDAIFFGPGIGPGLYLSRIEIDRNHVFFFVSVPFGDDLGRAVLSRSEPLPASQEYYRLTFLDTYRREAGMLFSDSIRLASFLVWEEGIHRFSPDATPFAARCCQPALASEVQGFLVNGELVTGDVMIVGDFGVGLKVYQITESQADRWQKPANAPVTNLGVIQVNVIGDPLFLRRCDPEFHTPRFLKELKVVAYPTETILLPDAAGNVEIRTTGHFEEDTTLRVTGSLRFEVAGPSLRS